MTLFSRVRAAISGFISGRSRPRRTVPEWADWIIGHPYIPPEQLDEDFRDAFHKVPIVAASIGRVQHDVASLPVRVWMGKGEWRKEMERKDGNLVDLLHKANPRDTGYQLRVATVGALKTHGNAYWFLQRFPGRREPGEIWHLPPHLMEVQPGEGRGISRYWYNRGGNRAELAPEDIIHFRKYNPDDSPIGMSELEPVRRDYEAQFYALIWLREFFRKGGMVSGVWSVKEGSTKLTDAKINAVMERLKSLHVGYNKAWDPVVVEGLEFVRRGLTLSEMELDKHLDIMNANICRAVGVPPWMMGIKEGSTLGSSGANVDLLDYTLGTLKREATLIDTTINEQLAPLFGADIEVETDFSSTLAVQGAMLEQSKSLVIATGRAILTVNEARRRQGLEPHVDPTADELYIRSVPAFGEPGAAGDEPSRLSAVRLWSRVKSMIDGNEEREQLRRRASSALERAEGRMLIFLRGRLEDQERVAVNRLRERWARETSSSRGGGGRSFVLDFNTLMDPEDPEDGARVRRILEELLRKRGREAVGELSALVEIAEEIEVRLNSERVLHFLEQQVDRAIIVPDGTTAQMLRESLGEGVMAGESLDGLVARVRSVFVSRQSMAATIARTEVLPGYNLASQEAWRESGVVEEQEWLSVRDAAVREAHADADGLVVQLNESFMVGGEALAYPGDPRGSAENVINCRCTVLPVVSQDVGSQARWRRYWDARESRNGHGSAIRMRRYLQGIK